MEVFFGSAWFVLLPVFIYVLLPDKSWKQRYDFLLVLIIGIPSAGVATSRYFYPNEVFENKLIGPGELSGRSISGELFGNVRSLANFFGARGRYHNGIQYGEEDMGALKRIIDAHDVEIEGRRTFFTFGATWR